MTKKRRDISSESIKVNVRLPKGWHDLDQEQLREAFTFLAMEPEAGAVRCQAFLKWGGLRVAGTLPNGDFLVKKKGRKEFTVSPEQIAEAAMTLKFLDAIPEKPLRLEKIGEHQATHDVLLNGFAFGNYLVCDNYYTGYLKKRDESLLRKMATILYDSEEVKPDKAELLSVLYWWMTLKDFLAKEFPDLFSEKENNGTGNLLGDFRSERQKMREQMNTMIRALTKGDIIKEKDVLEADMYRAFAELDAMARENEEMKRKYNS